MTSETKIRNQLIRRIQRIPLDKLNELTEFVARIEKTASSKDKTLSYAGSWENLDALTFDNLTRNLIENRQSNKRRYE